MEHSFSPDDGEAFKLFIGSDVFREMKELLCPPADTGVQERSRDCAAGDSRPEMLALSLFVRLSCDDRFEATVNSERTLMYMLELIGRAGGQAPKDECVLEAGRLLCNGLRDCSVAMKNVVLLFLTLCGPYGTIVSQLHKTAILPLLTKILTGSQLPKLPVIADSEEGDTTRAIRRKSVQENPANYITMDRLKLLSLGAQVLLHFILQVGAEETFRHYNENEKLGNLCFCEILIKNMNKACSFKNESTRDYGISDIAPARATMLPAKDKITNDQEAEDEVFFRLLALIHILMPCFLRSDADSPLDRDYLELLTTFLFRLRMRPSKLSLQAIKSARIALQMAPYYTSPDKASKQDIFAPRLFSAFLVVLRNKLNVELQSEVIDCMGSIVQSRGLGWIDDDAEETFMALRLALSLSVVNCHLYLEQSLAVKLTDTEDYALSQAFKFAEALVEAMARDTERLEHAKLPEGTLSDLFEGIHHFTTSIFEYFEAIKEEQNKSTILACPETVAATRFISHWMLMDPATFADKFLECLSLISSEAPWQTFQFILPALQIFETLDWAEVPHILTRLVEVLIESDSCVKQNENGGADMAAILLCAAFLDPAVDVFISVDSEVLKRYGGIAGHSAHKKVSPATPKYELPYELPAPPGLPTPTAPLEEKPEVVGSICTAASHLFRKNVCRIPIEMKSWGVAPSRDLRMVNATCASAAMLAARVPESFVLNYLPEEELQAIWDRLLDTFVMSCPRDYDDYIRVCDEDVAIWFLSARIVALGLRLHPKLVHQLTSSLIEAQKSEGASIISLPSTTCQQSRENQIDKSDKELIEYFRLVIGTILGQQCKS